MQQQILVIGLGEFGMALARAVAAQGAEVLAVDRKQPLVDAAAAFVAEAACFDATDEDRLSEAAPQHRDVCVCAIGAESREKAIMVTALLRQMGARRVIARAADETLERILRLVGAHEVVNPERAFGRRLASRLTHHGVVDEMPLGDELVITELEAPPFTVGRNLIELELPRRFGVTVVAIRSGKNGATSVRLPDPSERIGEADLLVVVSSPEALRRLSARR